ncbi:MAG: cytochrome C oxidase subunit IV family protein [Gemmatimonadota bacterium]|jgi:cytochrome c oxidase subunit 4
MADNRSGAAHELAHQEHGHPGTRTYIMVAVVLTIITAAEVAVAYMPALRPVLAYILIALSAAKFSLVVMYYMHLKFDSRIFSGVFLAPFSLALVVVVALVILFKLIPFI